MARTKKEKGFREKIIRVAATLIIQRGVSHTSLADIAKSLSISPGTLFYYFPSKGDLVFEIIQRHIQIISDKIFHWVSLVAGNKDPITILTSVMKIFLDTKREVAEIHLFLIHEALIGNEKVKNRFRHAYHGWSLHMREGVRKVLPDSPHADILAEVIIALLDGLLIQLLLGVEIAPYQDLSQFLLNEHNSV